MKFIYRTEKAEYVVESEKDVDFYSMLASGGQLTVKFLSRVDGGRGRMPTEKSIDVYDLTPLINSEEAAKWAQKTEH